MLDGLDLEVPTGSLTAVLGPSGCGKTTLLRLLAGFEHADGGAIRARRAGRSPTRAPTSRPSGAAIGFVPQEGALFPHLDVAANVGFGLPRAAAPRRPGGGAAGAGRPRRAWPSASRTSSPAASSSAWRWPGRWRPEPGLVLLDEPFDALDAGLRAQVRGEVREALRAAGATALLVTHDQEEALSLADIVAVMRGGRIVQAADPQTLYRDPVDAEVAGFLGEAVLLRGAARRRTRRHRARPPADPRRATASTGRGRRVMLRPEQILCQDAGPPAAPRRRAAGCSRPRSTGTTRPPESPWTAPAAARSSPAPPGTCCPQVGDEVSIVVEGTALAYPTRPAVEQ